MLELLHKYYYGNYNHIIYHGIILIGIVIGTIRFPKLSTSSRIFFLLLVITPFAELTGFYFAVKYKNNSPVSNSFTLIEYGCFCLAFYWDSKIKLILGLLAGLVIFSIANNIFFQSFFTEQATNTALLLSLCEIVIFFLFLVLYFKIVDSLPLRNFSLFWIGMGIMLFSIISIVAFGFLEFNKKGDSWYMIAAYARQYSNYILYLLFIPAFLSPQKSLRDFFADK